MIVNIQHKILGRVVTFKTAYWVALLVIVSTQDRILGSFVSDC